MTIITTNWQQIGNNEMTNCLVPKLWLGNAYTQALLGV